MEGHALLVLSETMGLDVIKDFKSHHEEVGRIIEQISKVKNIFNIEFDPNNLKHLIFTQEKLTVMLKIDAMDDDSRNPDWADGDIEALEKFLQLGKSKDD